MDVLLFLGLMPLLYMTWMGSRMDARGSWEDGSALWLPGLCCVMLLHVALAVGVMRAWSWVLATHLIASVAVIGADLYLDPGGEHWPNAVPIVFPVVSLLLLALPSSRQWLRGSLGSDPQS